MLDVETRGPAEPEPPLPPEPESPPEEPEPPVPVGDDRDGREVALEKSRESLVAQAAALQVVDAKSYEQAAELARTFAGMVKDAEAHFDPDIAKAYALHRSLCEKKTSFLAPLKAALDAMKERARAWWDTEEQKRKTEAARLKAIDDKRREDEAARLLAESEEARKFGDVAAAVDLAQEAVAVQQEPPPPPPPSSVPRGGAARGMTHRANWTFEITDKAAFVKAVADGTISLEAIQENAVYLRGRAKADKNTLRWPGVRFFNKGSTSVRS